METKRNFSTYFRERKYYETRGKGMKEKYKYLDPQTLEQCVSDALTNGNHFLFAKFYLEKCKSSEELYKEKVIQYRKSRLKKNNGTLLFYNAKAWIAPKTGERKKKEVSKKYEKDELFYSTAQNYKFLNGDAGSREAILQFGICCRLSIRQVNELLNLRGYNELYMLNIMDVLTAYMLRKNAALEERDIITYDEAQKILNSFYDETREEIGKFEKLQKDKVPHLKTFEYGLGKPMYGKKLNDVLEENIGSWKQDEKHQEYFDQVTLYYKRKFDAEEEFKAFFDTVFSPIFGFIRYSFPQKVLDCIKNEHKYMKNKYRSGCRLYGEYSEKMLAPYEEKAKLLNNSRAMDLVGRIYKYANIIDIPSESSEMLNKDFKSNTAVYDWYRGRYVKINDSEKKESITLFEPNMGDYRSLFRFAVATGNEDENDLDEFLSTAGFGFCIAEKNDDGSSLEYTRALFSYALYYRDALIEKWCHDNEKLDKIAIKERFPFIELLMYINRDIETSVWCKYDINSSEIIPRLDALIYPVEEDAKIYHLPDWML